MLGTDVTLVDPTDTAGLQSTSFPPDGMLGFGLKTATKSGASCTGDLTKKELKKIQDIVNSVGEELHVVGSAARAQRRNVGSTKSIGKGANQKSDIDYITTSLSAKKKFDSANLPDVDPAHGVIKRKNGPKANQPSIGFMPK